MAVGKAYHRYFEGFSERKVWDDDKKKFRIETYYSGDYYRAELPAEEKKRLKVAYGAAYACAVMIFLLTSVIKTASSVPSPITAIPTLVILLGLMWQFPPLFVYLRAKELLIMREFRDRKNFMSMCMGLFCCFAVSAAVHLGYAAAYGSWADWKEWIVIAGLLFDAGIFYGIYRQEHSVTYRTVPNEAKIPEDCYDIKLREK